MHSLIAAVAAMTFIAQQDAESEYLPAEDQQEAVFELYTAQDWSCAPCLSLRKALTDAGLLGEDAEESCVKVLGVRRSPGGGILPDGSPYSRASVPMILCPAKSDGSREVLVSFQAGDPTWVRTVASLKKRYATQIQEFNNARKAKRERQEATKVRSLLVPEDKAVAIVESTDDKLSGAMQGLAKHLSFISQEPTVGKTSMTGAILDVEIDVPDNVPKEVESFLRTRRYRSGDITIEWPFSTSLTLEGSTIRFSSPLRITYDSVVDVKAQLHSIHISDDGTRYTLDLQGRVLNVPDLVLVLK